MIPEPEPTPVDDPDFPSGEWVGFYLQSGERYRQDLRLQFTDGRVSGSGDDNIGVFAIRGHYDAESLEVTWTKSYATHSVWYRGFREIKGIWGTWEIPEDGFAGGFHIWPRGQDAGQRRKRHTAVIEGPKPAITLPGTP